MYLVLFKMYTANDHSEGMPVRALCQLAIINVKYMMNEED
jgi:hypothetical protein